MSDSFPPKTIRDAQWAIIEQLLDELEGRLVDFPPGLRLFSGHFNQALFDSVLALFPDRFGQEGKSARYRVAQACKRRKA